MGTRKGWVIFQLRGGVTAMCWELFGKRESKFSGCLKRDGYIFYRAHPSLFRPRNMHRVPGAMFQNISVKMLSRLFQVTG